MRSLGHVLLGARRAALGMVAALGLGGPALASGCFGIAEGPTPPYAQLVHPAHFAPGTLASDEVGVTFVGHATFRIETPAGVMVATDYAGGFAGRGPLPNVVTMNNAHETHYTDRPNPEITHILRGWGERGAAAKHDLEFLDMRIRNVPTDLLYFQRRVRAGNSIFIFEVGDLCIGHLGHLHHVPTDEQFAQIGFLDVVLAPVDGVFTLSQEEIIATLKRLRARVVIPMHYFGQSTLDTFVAGMRDQFEIRYVDDSRLRVSKATLPGSATVVVLNPLRTPRDD